MNVKEFMEAAEPVNGLMSDIRSTVSNRPGHIIREHYYPAKGAIGVSTPGEPQAGVAPC